MFKCYFYSYRHKLWLTCEKKWAKQMIKGGMFVIEASKRPREEDFEIMLNVQYHVYADHADDGSGRKRGRD
jgi:hypothetical protein